MDKGPPKWALKFLRWYCHNDHLEIIEGDLFELFEFRKISGSPSAARRRFAWDVLRFFRLRYIKGFDIMKNNSSALFNNYFKVSFRNLVKQKFFSFINILGLSVGLACTMLMLLFINNELSYDKHIKENESVYRVMMGSGGVYTPARLGITMANEFPEVKSTTRFNGPIDYTFVVGSKIIRQEGGFYADSTFFDVFGFDLLQGNRDKALTQPNSIILTTDLAVKYFPDQDPLNKTLKVDNQEMLVTGVIENSPKTSHMKFEYIASLPHEEWISQGNWTGNNFFTYVKLSDEANPQAVNTKLEDLVRKYIGDEIIKFSGHESYDAYLADGNSHSFTIVPITDIHLKYPFLSMTSAGNLDNIYIFSSVGIFILILACINFMNLSTARASSRSKEVGMRKVLGSINLNITAQFLIESLLISFISLVFAFFITGMLLPIFNQVTANAFSYMDLLRLDLILYYILATFITGILAGSYPAFFMAGFSPITALKGILKTSFSNVVMRKGLVVFQFAICMILIASTFITYFQIDFLLSKNLGLNTEQTVVIKNIDKLENIETFANKISVNSAIESYSFSNNYPSGGISNWGYKTVDNRLSLDPDNIFTDNQFIDVYDIKLLQGRYFNKDQKSDSASVVINKNFAEKLPWDNPINQQLSRGSNRIFTIIGVVDNFNYGSLKNGVRPLVIRHQDEKEGMTTLRYMNLKINGNIPEAMQTIEKDWKTLMSEEPFDYVFTDAAFKNLYESEARFGLIFTAFSTISIFIACLGIFGLATFMLKQRLKEIAIRKIMGANIVSMFSLLLSDFTKWVALGGIIGIPIAYFFMNEWLSNFAYQNTISVIAFIIPLLILFVICWSIVASLIYRISKANPSTVLRSD